MIETRRLLGYRKVGRTIKGSCSDIIAGQDVKGGRPGMRMRLGVKSRNWVLVKRKLLGVRYVWCCNMLRLDGNHNLTITYVLYF